MSQEQLAEKAKISRSHLSSIEAPNLSLIHILMGAALVSISARVDTVKIPVDFLLDSLRKVDGVQTIENITGEQKS